MSEVSEKLAAEKLKRFKEWKADLEIRLAKYLLAHPEQEVSSKACDYCGFYNGHSQTCIVYKTF